MEPDEPETIASMAQPSYLTSEDDDVRGAADLGELVGHLDHGMGGDFVAKFTRVVEWPSVSFATLPNVPQGMKLEATPGVVRRWHVEDLLQTKKKKKSKKTRRRSISGAQLESSQEGKEADNNKERDEIVVVSGEGGGGEVVEVKPVVGFRGVVLSDICEVVHPEFEQSRSLDLAEVQMLARDTNAREMKRQLQAAELELRRQAQEQRLREAELNRQQLDELDHRNRDEQQVSRVLHQRVAATASDTMAFVAEKSSSLVHLKIKRDELLDAHGRSVMRLKRLEAEMVRDVKTKVAQSFVAAMRSKGEKATADTNRKVVRELGRLLL